MPGIIQTAVANAVLVTAAAPVVWAIARTARRPVLTHALWLVVLFKLLTPPLWVFPVQIPRPKVAAPIEPAPRLAVAPPVASGSAVSTASSSYLPAVSTNELVEVVPSEPVVTAAVPAAPVAEPFDWQSLLVPALEIIWALGALLCLIVAAVRVTRFSRALRWAGPAPAGVQARVDTLARLLRLGAAPRVQFIPGTLCPMLWPIGRSPRLLVPQALWERLDPIQCDTVLLHELAHWARRDHWVRWIELLATSLYWWLPACWWARRELRKAEEQCCDAWVLWAMPGTFHNYANALLEAVEFVSVRADRPSASIAVPALASGMGQFSDLQGRLTMLKHGNVSRALSWGGMAAVFGLGALLLPISPTVGQDAPAQEVAQPTPAPDAPRADQAPRTPFPPTPAAPAPGRAWSAVAPTPIDQSIEKMLSDMKILPSEDCTDAEYIRRACLDLLGVPPDPDSVRAFQDDPAPRLEKRQLLLQKLLAREEAPAGPYARQLLESQQRIDELTRRLQEADARIAALKAQQDRQAATADSTRAQPGSGPMPNPAGAASPFGGQSTSRSGAGYAPVPMAPNQNKGAAPGTPEMERRPEAPAGFGIVVNPPGQGRAVFFDPSNGRLREIGPDGAPREIRQGYRIERFPVEGDSDRLDKVEAQVQALLREIQAMRSQSAAPSPGAAGTGLPPTAAPAGAPAIAPPTGPTLPPGATPGDLPATR